MKPENIKEQELSEEQLDEATGGHTNEDLQQNRCGNKGQNRCGNSKQNRTGNEIAPGRG